MGGGASMAKESTLDEAKAARLAERCRPNFKKKGLPAVASIESVSIRRIQSLWTGMGSIDEIIVTAADGTECSFITKLVGTPKELEKHEISRDHKSYYVEAAFYEKGHADKLCSAGALCPRPLLIDKEDEGILRICITKLPGGDFDGEVGTQNHGVLTWLARMHAMFWGNARADKAVASGLHQQGCYWHFDTRQKELGEMSTEGLDGRLKLAAAAIDERMKADHLQAICHGDVKGPNVMYDPTVGVSLFDFQWTGKCAVTKDLAYFMACCAREVTSSAETILLQHYLAELSTLLQSQKDKAPSFEELWDSYTLACVDLARWMAGWGWWGNPALLKSHVQTVLDKLDAGEALASEDAYRDQIFKVFPVPKTASNSRQSVSRSSLSSPSSRQRLSKGNSSNQGLSPSKSRTNPNSTSSAAATPRNLPGSLGRASSSGRSRSSGTARSSSRA